MKKSAKVVLLVLALGLAPTLSALPEDGAETSWWQRVGHLIGTLTSLFEGDFEGLSAASEGGGMVDPNGGD